MRLVDRRVMITGGSSGIGLELARLLAVDNTVVIAGRDRERLGQAVANEPGLHAVQLDVTSEIEARAAVADVVQRLGGLDLLVNAAGILRPVPFGSDAAAAAAEAEVAVNLLGSMRMTRLALPHLRRSDEGTVVLISSALALTAAPGLASYAASKAAVHSLARSLRAELAGVVRVIEALPPFVDTPLARSFEGVKLAPAEAATAIAATLRSDGTRVSIGRVRALTLIERLVPSAADRIIARELRAFRQPAIPGPTE